MDCCENEIILRDAQLCAYPLRKLFPNRGGHADEFPGQQGRLMSAVTDHDGAHINMVVNPLKPLRAARISRHGECGVGSRGDVHSGGANL